MKILFIHQNFPGQYLHLAQYLRARGGHEVVGLGESENVGRRGTLYGISTIGYPKPEGAGPKTHHYLQSTEAAVRRGQAAARALLNLRKKGFVPDVISLHPGWGEGLFARDVYPHVPIVMFCEFFFQADQADLSFDPEFPSSVDWSFGVRVRNAPQLISLTTANVCLCPTQWQASRYPAFVRERLHIIHDGIDTVYMHPEPLAFLKLRVLDAPGESRVVEPCPPAAKNARAPGEPASARGGAPLKGGALQKSGPEGGSPVTSGTGELAPAGAAPDNMTPDNISPGKTSPEESAPEEGGTELVLTRADKIVTYVARNLEPYRGFHVFMRALPELQRRHPDARVLVVGADGTSYSPALPGGETYKSRYLKELEGRLDLSRIHFLGKVPYVALRALLRISSVHVYLTYPFVLSWSVLEAMSCEGLLVASRTPPVEEVVTHGRDGLLVDFFDREELVETVSRALDDPERFAPLRKAARETVLERFELGACLEKQVDLLERAARGEFPADM